MYSCADIGKERADEILIRVPLRLDKQNEVAANPGERQAAAKVLSGEVVGVLQEVNKACFEHQRERTRRTICRVRIVLFRCDHQRIPVLPF
jgi:nuclear pore complex protein Nup85